jgi:hypothetical protein
MPPKHGDDLLALPALFRGSDVLCTYWVENGRTVISIDVLLAQYHVLVVGGIQVGLKLTGGLPELVVQGFEELLFHVVHGFSRGCFGNMALFRITHGHDIECRCGGHI